MLAFDALEHDRALSHQRNRSMKLMRSAAQRLELRACASAVAGFGKPPLAKRQGLVGAQYQPAGKASGNRSRLLPRQQRGEFASIARRAPLLNRPLVDIGRLDLDRNSGVAQEGIADRALGREHERFAGEPKRHRSSDRLATTLGEKAHNRRSGLLDRAPRDVDARPIVPGAQLARERDLLGDRLAVDILIAIVMRPEPEQAILADLYDPLGTGI